MLKMEYKGKVMIIIYIVVIGKYVISQMLEDYPYRPEKCEITTDLMDRRCCIFPPFFTRESAKRCGAIFAVMYINKQANVTGFRRRALRSCSHWRCILRSYELLTQEETLDEEKYYLHLDKWINTYPDFGNVMLNAKVRCKQTYRFYMPLKPCEFFDFHSCIRNYINVNCPRMINSRECMELKEFYDDCREYYE